MIFDVNRLGQSEPTSLQHNMEVYRKRLDAFGFNAIVVDGHDVEELCKAFHEAAVTTDKPTAIIAKTFKGKFFPSIEGEFEITYRKKKLKVLCNNLFFCEFSFFSLND